MWRSAAVVHLIMMTIVLFMYARRDEELDAWIFVQAGLAAIVVGFGVMPLFTGVVEWRDASYPAISLVGPRHVIVFPVFRAFDRPNFRLRTPVFALNSQL